MDELKDALRRAYIAGATDVHNNWQADRDPCFKEAASDYVASLDLADLARSEAAAVGGR